MVKIRHLRSISSCRSDTADTPNTDNEAEMCQICVYAFVLLFLSFVKVCSLWTRWASHSSLLRNTICMQMIWARRLNRPYNGLPSIITGAKLSSACFESIWWSVYQTLPWYRLTLWTEEEGFITANVPLLTDITLQSEKLRLSLIRLTSCFIKTTLCEHHESHEECEAVCYSDFNHDSRLFLGTKQNKITKKLLKVFWVVARTLIFSC